MFEAQKLAAARPMLMRRTPRGVVRRALNHRLEQTTDRPYTTPPASLRDPTKVNIGIFWFFKVRSRRNPTVDDGIIAEGGNEARHDDNISVATG